MMDDMLKIRRILLLALCAWCAAIAVGHAQQKGGVLQSGLVTPGHAPIWVTSGVIGDAGSALSGNLTELGITNTGTPLCINDAPITGQYHQFCLGANVTVGGAAGGLISYNAYGGAPALPLRFNINGTLYNPAASPPVIPPGGLPIYPSAYNADLTGVNDATAALQSCVNAAGPGGTCHVNYGAILKISGNVSIPAHTTLRCTDGFPDSSDSSISSYNTQPAIKLAGNSTISAGGTSASIDGCLIYRDGMTFPAPNASAYFGTALNDNGNYNFAVTNSEVIGFDTCFTVTGSRPYFSRDYFDCSGVSTAAGNVANGNTDSGFFLELKFQPLGTGNGACPASLRNGTGLLMGGTNFFDNIVTQNFTKNQYEVGAALVLVGKIWADNNTIGPGCSYGTTIGVKLDPGAVLYADDIYIFGQEFGIVFQGATLVPSTIGLLTLNLINGDCIVVGSSTEDNGPIQIDRVVTSTSGIVNCGQHAINIVNNTFNLLINSAILQGVNGIAPPYIVNTSGNPAYLRSNEVNSSLYISQLRTDLPAGTNPYSGFSASTGSEIAMAGAAPIVSGCPTSVTCVLLVTSDIGQGIIQLTAGTGAGATGNVAVTFPLPFIVGRVCQLQLLSGTGAWAPSATIQEVAGSATVTNFAYFNGGVNLTSGSTYDIGYICRAL